MSSILNFFTSMYLAVPTEITDKHLNEFIFVNATETQVVNIRRLNFKIEHMINENRFVDFHNYYHSSKYEDQRAIGCNLRWNTYEYVINEKFLNKNILKDIFLSKLVICYWLQGTNNLGYQILVHEMATSFTHPLRKYAKELWNNTKLKNVIFYQPVKDVDGIRLAGYDIYINDVSRETKVWVDSQGVR